jgi:hypothetical protein
MSSLQLETAGGINRSHEVTSDDGMLLFPLGNLSHTSIFYYWADRLCMNISLIVLSKEY